MKELWPIIASVLGVFLVMASGAVCRRRDWLTPEADRSLASLTANLLLPAYLFDRVLSGAPFDSVAGAWVAPAFGFASTATGFVIGWFFARRIGRFVGLDTDAKQRAFALCVGICNYGYIPLPLAEQFYPDAIVDLILHNVGVELAMWSIGIAIISGTAGGNWRRALTSPALIAVAVAILLRIMSLASAVPDPVMTAVGALGDCAIPMGLLLGGAIIVDFLDDGTWYRSPGLITAAIGIRQVLMPMIMLSAAAAFATTTDMRQVMMLQAAMPVAVFPLVLVRLYDQDARTALQVVLSTSLAAVVLIPLWLAIGKWWLGV